MSHIVEARPLTLAMTNPVPCSPERQQSVLQVRQIDLNEVGNPIMMICWGSLLHREASSLL